MPTDFLSLGVRPELNELLKKQGATVPTPVQMQAIPIVFSGKDIVAQAQTGTGKTFAFLLPILERVDGNKPYVQALIITPTRELALQITAELNKLAFKVNAKVLTVYGGQDIYRQVKKLRGSIQIVVGTPGRILDHIRRRTIKLSDAKMLVLDEADQMLDMGFLPDVEKIIKQTSSDRQTMLFSATIPASIRNLAKKYMNNPVNIKIESKSIILNEIKQMAVATTERTKQETLFRLFAELNPYLALVFCRTKRRTAALNKAFLEHGYLSDELHGDLSQNKRDRVMKRFRETKIQVLAATDVAARGLDVEGITHVINYDIPQDAESYIHRIGRTGRAGEKGLAVTLVTPKDRFQLRLIEKGIGMPIETTGQEQVNQDHPEKGRQPSFNKFPGKQPYSQSKYQAKDQRRNKYRKQENKNRKTRVAGQQSDIRGNNYGQESGGQTRNKKRTKGRYTAG